MQKNSINRFEILGIKGIMRVLKGNGYAKLIIQSLECFVALLVSRRQCSSFKKYKRRELIWNQENI